MAPARRDIVNKKLASAGAILACAALTAVGCGSSGSKSGGGTTVAGADNNAKTVTPQMAQNPKGNVTWCNSKDTTGRALVQMGSAALPGRCCRP